MIKEVVSKGQPLFLLLLHLLRPKKLTQNQCYHLPLLTSAQQKQAY